jgi:hypothetical protein
MGSQRSWSGRQRLPTRGFAGRSMGGGALMSNSDLQKGAPKVDNTDKVKAHEAVDRVRRLLRSEARRHWKENPLITGGDVAYQPAEEEA